ncbi:MAG: peptidylprolyl isomerase [Gemmatimonadetes bacterium]|nr:peptidylprolyl isomerase [Gemmatimonadota bacterium]
MIRPPFSWSRIGAALAGCAALSVSGAAAQDLRSALLRPDDPSWAQTAPDTFRARFTTSQGDFILEVVRAWAPRGADHFWNLVRHGYYDDARFHRVVPGFIVQWGVAGDPRVSAVWLHRTILDDSVEVASNVRGTIAFAFTDKDTRATQVYINLVDNIRLDAQGFRPFGRVVEGMDVVDSLYGGYGESSGGGMRAAKQDSLVTGGNAYLDRVFPRLDHLIRAVVLNR